MIDKYLSIDPDARAVLVSNNLMDFAQSHPGEHSAYLCQCIKGDMMEPLQELGGQSFVGIVNLMNALPPDSPQQVELRKSLAAYANRIFQMASKPFEVKPKAAPEQPKGPDPRAQELDAREQKIRENEMKAKSATWVNASRADKNTLYNSEFDRLAKGLTISDQRKAAIKTLAEQNIAARMKAVPNLLADLKGHFESDDREGYLRTMAKVYRDVVPPAVKAAFDAVIDSPRTAPARPTVPAVRTPAPSNGTPRPQARQEAPPTSWEQITGTPASSDVDMHRTTRQMILKGQFILKNGRRVQRV